MPRYNIERDFQLGEYWLSQRRGSDAWHRTWFDPKSRQTKRVSLRTTDIEHAKAALTDWFVLNHNKKAENPEDVLLAEIFARYYKHYASKLRTSGNVQRALRDWLDFHGEASVEEACQLVRQLEFREWLSDKRRLAPNTVRQILTIGKAALNWTWKRGEIAAVPHIELVKVPTPAPKGRPMDAEEVARLIKHADYHLKVFIVMMIATTGRTRAVLDLTFDRIDFESDLIELNPRGREQTLKYRPTVKLPLSLKPWLLEQCSATAAPTVVSFRGAPVLSIRSGWRTIRSDLNMGKDVQPYGIRHTMARWL